MTPDVIEYHLKKRSPCVQACIRIPKYLREFASESGINMSGTLRAALEAEYQKRGRAATDEGESA